LRDDDDRFYMLAMQDFRLSALFKMYMGMDLGVGYAEKIEIEGAGPVDFDGDAEGALPCRVTPAAKLQLITTP
jgi:hypothetical protein